MEEELKINKKMIKLIFIFSLVSAFVIDIVHNLNINEYLKNFIIPISIILFDYIFIILKENLDKNKKAYLLLIPISLILFSDMIIGIAPINKFLNIFVLPVIMSIFFISLTNTKYKIDRNSFKWIFSLFPKKLFSNLKYNNDIIPNNKNMKIKNIVLGLIISIPIGIVILSLLTSADKYFSSFIYSITKFLPDISINRVFDLIIIALMFIIIFSTFINIIIKSKDKNMKIFDKKEINITISSILLIILNLIYLVFVISEVSRLTGNFLQLPIEYTYAEYAREGFFQLLIVTAINFYVIVHHIYNKSGLEKNAFIKYSILILTMFSLILIFNSYYRMFLYIQVYSFTILRLQVLLFLTMELIIFIMLIFKLFNKLKIKENIVYTIILLIFYILNLYLCNDLFIKSIS